MKPKVVTGYAVTYRPLANLKRTATPKTWSSKSKAKNSRFFKKCKKLGWKPRVRKVTR